MDQIDWKCSKRCCRKTCHMGTVLTNCKAFKTKWTRCRCVHVIMNSPLAKSFLRLNPADKDSLRAKFNTMYYVLKRERPFTDYPDLLNLQTKNGIIKLCVSYSTLDESVYFAVYIGKVMHEDLKKLISKANYFSLLLSDGSTDSTVIEQKTIYVLFICEGMLLQQISRA